MAALLGVITRLGTQNKTNKTVMRRCSSAVPSTSSFPALPMRIAPEHPASLTPPPTAVMA